MEEVTTTFPFADEVTLQSTERVSNPPLNEEKLASKEIVTDEEMVQYVEGVSELLVIKEILGSDKVVATPQIGDETVHFEVAVSAQQKKDGCSEDKVTSPKAPPKMSESTEAIFIPPEDKKSKLPKKKFICNICSKEFPYKISLQRHKSIHGRKKIKCHLCPEILDEHKMGNHLLMNHQAAKCNICEGDFPSKAELRVHVSNAHSKIKKRGLKPGRKIR